MYNKRVFERSILLTLGAILFLTFVFAMDPIISLTPTTYTNVSGTIQLNGSIPLTSNATNMTWQFINSSDNITFNVSLTSDNATRFNTTFDTTQIPDGKYNVTIIAHNVSDSTVTNNSIINITIDNTAPNVTILSLNGTENFTNGYKSGVNITVRSLDATTVVDSVTFNITNGSNSFIIVGVPTAGNRYNVTLNTSTMVEGNATITVIANDSVNNQNKSANVTITVDLSGPILTAQNNPDTKLNPIDNSNLSPSAAAGGLIFNLTLRDRFTRINTVRLNVTNGSNHTVISMAITSGTNLWNASLNGSGLLEGVHNVTILMNDSLGNENNSNNYSFIVDRTRPNVTILTSSSKIETLTLKPTISYKVTDNIFGRLNCTISSGGSVKGSQMTTNGTETSFTFGTLENDKTHSYNVSCTDGSGNSDDFGSTLKIAVPVAAAATSSSGGGTGGTGGATAWSSKSVKSQYYRKGWSSLSSGSQSFTTNDDALGVTKISFDVSKTMRNTYLLVKPETDIPGKFNGPIYKYVQISPSGSFDQSLISDVTISFVVDKVWLQDNGVSKNDISLFRVNKGNFDRLATTVGAEKGNMITFTAATPGFSYFIIGKEVVKVVKEDPVVVEEPAAPTLEAPAAPEATGNAVSEGSSSTPVAAILAVIGVLAIAGVIISKKKRN